MNGYTGVRLVPDNRDLVIVLTSDDATIDDQIMTIPAHLIDDFRDQIQQLFEF
jgi:hypothetical protein